MVSNTSLKTLAYHFCFVPGIIAALIFVSAGFSYAWAAGECRHDLKIELLPEEHKLVGHDNIALDDFKGGELSFAIAGKAAVKAVRINGRSSKYSFSNGKLSFPGITAVKKPLRISISYEAVFDDPVESEMAGSDNPGFGVVGTIGGKGALLLSDSGWYPGFPALPESFDLEVRAPKGIYAVTTGELIGHKDIGAVSISAWKTGPIGQGLSLSAGRYIVRSEKKGRIPVYTYFTSENDSLSKTYLDAAASHIEFYERLHGPYPFAKFAVVENFFPTGYGFPSYTLLGATVLRLPFIPETSLRHEVAHSWWGNGVLVDYQSGNWCEGLTSYVADYLSKEISSPEEGKLYRRQILRDYATLAASGKDFPLRLFTSRSSPATRAVGYGKAAFVFHMIRQRIGDGPFWDCLRQIYKERLFKKTSWQDFMNVFIKTGGWDPQEATLFFRQWIERAGAPDLRLSDVKSEKTNDSGWKVSGTLLQKSPPYNLKIVAALTAGAETNHADIGSGAESVSFSIQSHQSPQKLILDPDANIFRLLAPREIPSVVNSIKGARDVIAVLADGETLEFASACNLLLAGLNHADTPVLSEKEALTHSGIDFLFLGFPQSEKLQRLLTSAPGEAASLIANFRAINPGSEKQGDCLFLVFKDPNREGGLLALFLPVPGTSEASILAAARKITHYGNFSYLIFSDGVMQRKGEWEPSGSPLEFDFAYNGR